MKTYFTSALALLCLALAGCNYQPPPPNLGEDTYTSEVTSKQGWSVRSDGYVVIEIDQEGVINVYGAGKSNGNGGTSYPNVKLSGSATFKVHTCNNVTIDDGVTAQTFNCDLVRAGHQSTVDAYQCGLVRAYHDVKAVRPHGTTRVERLSAPPATPQPVEKSK